MPIQDWRTLKRMLELKQGGYNIQDDDLLSVPEYSEEEWKQIDDAITSSVTAPAATRVAEIASGAEDYRQRMHEIAELGNTVDDGYGEYKGDYNVPYESWVGDPINYRARSQSSGEKFRNGITKLIPYAATTYLDNTAGLISGILNVAKDAVDGGEFHAGDSFINNPLSVALQSIRDWSEKVLPNYRTQEELDDADKWWKHLNANFWGDVFLKNLGFTIGAGASGATYSSLFRKMQGKAVNEAYKAAASAAIDGNTSAEEAFRRVLQGGKMQDPKKIYDTFKGIRWQYNNLGVASSIVGGIGGAIGESRVEAMSSAKEFRDAQLEKQEQRLNKRKQDLLLRISSDSKYSNPDGSLTEEGYKIYTDELNTIYQDYTSSKKDIDTEAEKLANSVFGLNMPLLAGENMIMFGRMFSGGFNTQAKAKVRGKFGSYTPKNISPAGVAIKNTTAEGLEELSQKIISKGSSDIADYNVADFHNASLDKESIHTVSDWLLSMAESFSNVIASPSSWEEFAVGALTGALGMPTHVGTSNWSGGVIGGIQDAKAKNLANTHAAEELNKIISTDDFKNRWSDVVRHVYYEKEKDAALADNDSFTWHGANDAQLISDVVAFAKAGRLNDLEQYVDSFGDIKLEDIPSVRSLFADETDKDFNNKQDYQILSWIKKRVNEVKNTINQYRDFHDSIDFLSFGTSDDDAINELVYTQQQLKNFEGRYSRLLSEVISKVKPTIQEVARERKQDGTPSERAIKAQNVLSSEDGLERLFGGYAVDIHGNAAIAEENNAKFTAVLLDDVRQQEVLNELEQWGAFTKDPSVKKDVSDLQKLVRSRQNFYAKLFDPKFLQNYSDNSKTTESVASSLEKDASKKKADELASKLNTATNLKEYISLFESIPDPDPETLSILKGLIESNKKLSGFQGQIDSADSFVAKVENELALAQSNAQTAGDVAGISNATNALHDVDVMSVLSNMNEGVDPDIAVAKSILDKLAGDTKAQAIARRIIQNILGNKAQSEGLGEIPGGRMGGESGSGGAGGNNEGGSGQVDMFEHASKILDAITDLNSTLLKKIIDGDFSDFPGLSNQQKSDLTAKAIAIRNTLNSRFGVVVTGEGEKEGISALGTDETNDPNDPARIRAHADFVLMDTNSINGSKLSVYDVNELRKGRVKDYTTQNPGVAATLKWMRNHNVQKFIDSGALARLASSYEKKGEKLPVYFLGNPYCIENNLDNNPFATPYPGHPKYHNTASNVLLAVEINDDNREILSDYEREDIFSDDTLISIHDNGNDVKYQVIGVVWNPTQKEIDSKPDSEKEAYKNVKAEADRIWNYAIGDSILPQYIADEKRVGINSFSKTGKWYVAKIHPSTDAQNSENQDLSSGERLYTTLNYIMSGRNETRRIGEVKYEKIPLRDSLAEYERFGGEYYFAMPTSDDIIYTEDSPALPASINAPAGSLWMATQEANGAWGWTYITVATADEFDFDANKDTELVKEFDSALSTIFAPSNPNRGNYEEDFEKRHSACVTLANMFYLGKGNTFSLFFSDSGPGLSVGGAACFNRNDVIEVLKASKFRFQVNMSTINNTDEMLNLIDAGVLRSEMRSFIRKGASVGVNFLEDTDSEGNKVTPRPKSNPLSFAHTAGSESANVWMSSDSSVRNVRIGDTGYIIKPDNSVHKMSAGGRAGEKVDNKNTAAQVIAIAELMDISKSDGLSSYKGKRWIINKAKKQYTELFEREIDGIKVHIQQQGSNGGFKLIYGDALWNDLMEVAEEVQNKYVEQPAPSNSVTPEEQSKLDEILAKEQGGTPKGPVRKVGRALDVFKKYGFDSVESKTVQQQNEEDTKTADPCD